MKKRKWLEGLPASPATSQQQKHFKEQLIDSALQMFAISVVVYILMPQPSFATGLLWYYFDTLQY